MAEPITKNTTWYVEPRDAATNEVLAGNLEADDYIGVRICSDNKAHRLWQCDHAFIGNLNRSKKKLRLDFDVYVQSGRRGQIRLWVLEKSPLSIRPLQSRAVPHG